MKAHHAWPPILLSLFFVFLLSGCALIDGLSGSPDESANNTPDSGPITTDSGNPDANKPDFDTEFPDTEFPDTDEPDNDDSCGPTGISTADEQCMYPTEFSAGTKQTCALYKKSLTDEYGAIGCWPNNFQRRRKIIEIKDAKNNYTYNVKAITSGDAHACAIVHSAQSSKDLIYCWGDNSSGQLGNNSKSRSDTPVQAAFFSYPPKALGKIAAGTRHTCVTAENEHIHCWGDNTFRQLGVKVAPKHLQPDEPVETEKDLVFGPFHSITTKADHTCAIDSNTVQTMWCWGQNEHGELGYGSSTLKPPSFANKVSLNGIQKRGFSFTHIKDAATGPWHTCAVIGSDPNQSSGNVYCWGSGSYSQLGSGLTTNNAQPGDPVQTDQEAPLQASAVALGDTFSCALTPDHKKVMCWGGGSYRAVAKEALAINPDGSLTITQIAATSTQICALLIDQNQSIESTKIHCTTPPT